MSNLNLQKLREWVWPWPWTFKCFLWFSVVGASVHFKDELRQNGWKYTKIVCEQELLRLSHVSGALLILLVIAYCFWFCLRC